MNELMKRGGLDSNNREFLSVGSSEDTAKKMRVSPVTKEEVEYISVRSKRELLRIPVETIYFFKAEDKYITIFHKGGEHLTETSIKTLSEILGNRFRKIHRNCLVNEREMRSVSKGSLPVTLSIKSMPEIRLPISRRHTASIRRAVKGRALNNA